MFWQWGKRLGMALILIGIIMALVGAIPVLSPLQDGATPPDFRTLIIGAAVAGAGLVISLLAILLDALFPRDDFQN